MFEDIIFDTKQAVEYNGFIGTVFSRTSSQYHYHLTLLMQEYLETGSNGYQTYEALIIFNKNPNIADKILSEIEDFLDNPESITDENNWHDDLMQVLDVLDIHYQDERNVRKSISAQRLTAKLKQHKTELKIKQDQQEALENAILENKIQQQITLLRSSNTDDEIKQKLVNRTLPWEINPRYKDGPFRISVEYIRTGITEYTPIAKIPLFEELSRDYPDLMEYACNNAEKLPSEHIVKTKTIAWQQQLLKQDASLRIPRDVLQELLNTPPRLHSDLNKDNPSAPGYEVRQSREGTYVVIPLRVTLLKKYPDLINAADQCKLPILRITPAPRPTP